MWTRSNTPSHDDENADVPEMCLILDTTDGEDAPVIAIQFDLYTPQLGDMEVMTNAEVLRYLEHGIDWD